MSEPVVKKAKIDMEILKFNPTCQHFLSRKKRLCRMLAIKGKEYCAEHDTSIGSPQSSSTTTTTTGRIPCPYDPKHTVYTNKLQKHLKICNAKPCELPEFVTIGINTGTDDENDNDDVGEETFNMKLNKIDETLLMEVVEKVELVYKTFVENNIQEMINKHEIMKEELIKPEYGPETLKHLMQTSSIIGSLQELNFLNDDTCFIEFGAGKGQVSFWLSQAIVNLNNSIVILVDRASHRHKMDNKVTDKNNISRIRADIADLNLQKIPVLQTSKRLIGVSKHLCGAATDLALRCIVKANNHESCNDRNTDGMLIALCCHHRCDWKSFVGKKFFLSNGITKKYFSVLIKMVGWAMCGNGMSRERREEIENGKVGDGKGVNNCFSIENN